MSLLSRRSLLKYSANIQRKRSSHEVCRNTGLAKKILGKINSILAIFSAFSFKCFIMSVSRSRNDGQIKICRMLEFSQNKIIFKKDAFNLREPVKNWVYKVYPKIDLFWEITTGACEFSIGPLYSGKNSFSQNKFLTQIYSLLLFLEGEIN